MKQVVLMGRLTKAGVRYTNTNNIAVCVYGWRRQGLHAKEKTAGDLFL